MANRDDLAKALTTLRDVPSFREFVKTLHARRDSVVRQLLYSTNPPEVESLRGEARSLDWLIGIITSNS